MTTLLEQRVRKRLADLQARALWRTLRSPTGIDLSSNDYLGLSTHPLLIQRMMEATGREGCGSTGSRLLRGERESFSAVERRFAAFKRSERAIYFSSGYLANLATLTTLPEMGDVVFSDALNHASLIDGIRLSRVRSVIFPHGDVDALAQLLEEDGCTGQKFVVTESLFSMDGDAAPLANYAELCRANGAALLVDEAHAVGIYGERGSGLIEACGISEEVLISVNPAGKALGVSGAFVAGPAWAIEHLTQHARPFIFSTAAPPAIAAALDASLTVIDDEPERRHLLRARARYLRAQLAAAGISAATRCGRPGTRAISDGEASQIVPIVLGDNARATAAALALQREGFDLRAIRPPTVPEGTARLRIAVNVNLAESTIDRFVALLATIVHEASGPCTTSRCTAASS